MNTKKYWLKAKSDITRVSFLLVWTYIVHCHFLAEIYWLPTFWSCGHLPAAFRSFASVHKVVARHCILQEKYLVTNHVTFCVFCKEKGTIPAPGDKLQVGFNPKKSGASPNLKSVCLKKIPPLTYPENSWLFLKHSKEAFCKTKNQKMSYGDCLKVQKKNAKRPNFTK